MLQKPLWLWFVGLIGLALWAPSSKAQFSIGELGPSQILYEYGGVQVNYGRYADVEFRLTSPQNWVRWQILDGANPPGLALDSSQQWITHMRGTPQFSGQWCFLLGAQTSNQGMISQQVCLYSNPDFSPGIPNFQTDSNLPIAITNQFYQQLIMSNRSAWFPLSAQVVASTLPPSMRVDYVGGTNEQILKVSGSVAYAGQFTFTVLLSGQGRFNYRQFRLDARSQGGYQCPPGSYWDDRLGRCVPYGPQPPPPPGPYQCPPGWVYNPYNGRCEYAGGNQYQCPPGQHWNYDHCEPDYYNPGGGHGGGQGPTQPPGGGHHGGGHGPRPGPGGPGGGNGPTQPPPGGGHGGGHGPGPGPGGPGGGNGPTQPPPGGGHGGGHGPGPGPGGPGGGGDHGPTQPRPNR